jgi:hypothetical protein
VAPSLTRGWVCNLLVQFFLVLDRAFTLGTKSHRTHDHILLSRLRLPQPGGPGPCIYIPQEQGGPVITRALGSLSVASYDSQGCGGSILTRLYTGVCDIYWIFSRYISTFVWYKPGPMTNLTGETSACFEFPPGYELFYSFHCFPHSIRTNAGIV